MDDTDGIWIIHGFAVQGIGATGKQFEKADGHGHIENARFGDGLAVVQCFHHGIVIKPLP